MPNRDGTGPIGEGPGTGKGQGKCNIEKNLDGKRKGLGPCGDGTPKGSGNGCKGRRRGENGVTYYT